MTAGLRAAQAATLALPLFLLHGRGVAEGLTVFIALLFVAHCVATRSWAWLRTGWVPWAMAWWGWVVLSSVIAGQGLVQGAGVVRFLLLVAALEHWVLRDPRTRDWLARLLRWAALYLALSCLLQAGVGRNLAGYPRSGDGELTGPYANPRAGPPLARLLFPALLPPVSRWLGMPGWAPLGAAALGLGAVATMVLIGQRMPLLLTLLGLFVTALLLPRLRGVVLAAGVLGALLLGATSVVAPPTFYRLVTKFSTQMAHFPDSHYGQIAARSIAIGAAHPVFGAGYDAFRRECENPAYFQGWQFKTGGDDGGGAAMCVQHPHNHYLQAFAEGGWPGLVLFCAMVGAWLHGVGRGLWRTPDPLRVGLFVSVLLHVWPLASASAFASMPLSGWFFVILGLGLAEARATFLPTATTRPV